MTPDMGHLSHFCREAGPYMDMSTDELLDIFAWAFFDIREVESYLRDRS